MAKAAASLLVVRITSITEMNLVNVTILSRIRSQNPQINQVAHFFAAVGGEQRLAAGKAGALPYYVLEFTASFAVAVHSLSPHLGKLTSSQNRNFAGISAIFSCKMNLLLPEREPRGIVEVHGPNTKVENPKL